MEFTKRLNDKGLSPRLRGNLLATAAHGQYLWSIPAPAGEPKLWIWRFRSGKVYPRACGGTRSKTFFTFTACGLSPRLRGNPAWSFAWSFVLRSIPAPAGEPYLAATSLHLSMVYPRACGGTSLCFSSMLRWRGLSPRLRGNRQPVNERDPFAGSIPAPAGEPRNLQIHNFDFEVYPRACGGTQRSLLYGDVSVGLSPRLRGNLRRH